MKTPAGADLRRAWPAKVSTLRMRKCSDTSESLILPPPTTSSQGIRCQTAWCSILPDLEFEMTGNWQCMATGNAGQHSHRFHAIAPGTRHSGRWTGGLERKGEERSDAKEGKSHEVIPCGFFLEVGDREDDEDNERDDFLDDLELEPCELTVAKAVGRHFQTVFDQATLVSNKPLPEAHHAVPPSIPSKTCNSMTGLCSSVAAS